MDYMKISRILSAAVSLALAFSCSEKAESGNGGNNGGVPAGNTEVKISPDRTSVLKNPMTGWVMYLSADADVSYFDTEVEVSSGKTVKVVDYASACYIRTKWRVMNPADGKYFWDDPNNNLTKLVKKANELGLPVAFRVVVDGRDQGENTPMFVFEAGAEYWLDNDRYPDRKTPDVTDPIWRKYYEKFIEAFAAEFDDPDRTAFIDAYGLGKWGEGHNVCYEGLTTNSNGESEGIVSDRTQEYKEDTMEWITGLYSRCFTKVPLVINYHRQIGHPKSSGRNAQPDSEHLLEIAIDNGYCLRADSFGMKNQDWGYNNWERSFVKKWNFKVPVIMEGGYIVDSPGHQSGMKGDGYNSPADVREGEFLDSQEACVNMMDFRYGNETRSWFVDAFSYVERFVQEGGYRIYPTVVSVPSEGRFGDRVTVTHKWANLGWGYCPTNLKQWNQKYKVAFALLNDDDEPVKVFVDEQTDLSQWLKGKITSYTFDVDIKGVAVGGYTWAVGIVDTTKDNALGIRVAAAQRHLTDSGWVRIGTFMLSAK